MPELQPSATGAPVPAAAPRIAQPSRGARRRHPLLRFVARRLGVAAITLLVISLLIFLATSVLPGDAATTILGRQATPESLELLRQQLHLDQSAPERYVNWLSGAVTGDFGTSARSSTPVWELIKTGLVNSAILAGFAVLLLIPLSLLLGVLAATRAGRPLDHGISFTSLIANSLPEFVTGTLLILVFAVGLQVLPAVSLVPFGQTPLADPAILVLPVATLLAAALAWSLRMVRAGMIETLRSHYVEMARLNGYGERRVVLRHALPNGLAPAVQVFALNIQYLVGGIVVTEFLFGYPGLGQTLVEAVSARDIPLVQSATLLIAAIYLLINIVADVLVVLLIPKLRTAQ